MYAFFFLLHLEFQCSGSVDERISCLSREAWSTSTVIGYLRALHDPLIADSCDRDVSKKVYLVCFYEIRNSSFFSKKEGIFLSYCWYRDFLTRTSFLYEGTSDLRDMSIFPRCESFFIEVHISSWYISRFRLFSSLTSPSVTRASVYSKELQKRWAHFLYLSADRTDLPHLYRQGRIAW